MRQYRLSILSIIYLLFSWACNAQNEDITFTELVKTKQILLTNEAYFKKDRSMQGASSFLIKYQDSIYAVSAKHLLGEAMGISPEVKLKKINSELIHWSIYPRTNHLSDDTIYLNANNLIFDSLKSDILMLRTNNTSDIHVLSIADTLPKFYETVYLIGCPYSDEECYQNVYPLKYIGINDDLISCSSAKDIELSGFSGCPIVNIKGEVFGVLVSGFTSGKTLILYSTHINEIKKIKHLF